MEKDIYTLGIESSCDETSVAIVKNGREVLSNVIDTQIPIHEKYGGVVPEIASRNHIEAISRVTKKALEDANIGLSRGRCDNTNIWTRISRSLTCRGLLCESVSICIKHPISRSQSYPRTYSC